MGTNSNYTVTFTLEVDSDDEEATIHAFFDKLETVETASLGVRYDDISWDKVEL